MALLNPPEILPPLLRSIVEAAHLNGKPITDEKLIEMLSPGSDDEPGSIGVKEKRHVVYTHTAARELSLLEQVEGGSVPSAASMDALQRGSLRGNWPALLRTALLEHESAARAVKEAAAEDTRGVRDLLFAFTWFCAQDAYAQPLSWEGKDGYRSFQALQQRDFGEVTTRFPVQNDNRFGAFERWSLHLGIASADEFGARALRPIPIGIVRDTLPRFEAGTYEVDDFLERLGQLLPYLWPGALRQQLAEVLGSDPDPDVQAGGIDSSVAACLLTLEAEKRTRMEEYADAAQRSTITPRGDQPRTVTHIEVLA